MNLLTQKNYQKPETRRGVAAMEAAVCLPVLVMLIMGTIELGMALRVKTVLQSAVRESGRLANIDFSDIIEDGDTANAKIERDLRNFITASGFPGDKLDFQIVHASAPAGGGTPQPFDLGDPANDLQLFRIVVSIPFSEIGYMTSRWIPTPNISAELAMRAGQAGGLSN
jgi:hypothetical protein